MAYGKAATEKHNNTLSYVIDLSERATAENMYELSADKEIPEKV